MKAIKNKRLHDFQEARLSKKDEFYTSMKDIELELKNYLHEFSGKVVYCNCDDHENSNFFSYFYENFQKLGLKKLIATGFQNSSSISDRGTYAQYTASGSIVRKLDGDGDFRSEECISLLKEADIIVTNPPFSLFREFVQLLVDHKKKFLILGNMNAVTYKNIFPLIKDNEIWYGPSVRSGDREFRVPSDYPLTAAGSRIDEFGNRFIRVKGVRWFTNLDFDSRHVPITLNKSFSPESNPKYINYDAIEVGKTMDIPADYRGEMGVPISFLDKFCPEQFEIIGSSKTLSKKMADLVEKGTYQQGGPRFYLDNGDGTYKRMYERIVIKNKQLN